MQPAADASRQDEAQKEPEYCVLDQVRFYLASVQASDVPTSYIIAAVDTFLSHLRKILLDDRLFCGILSRHLRRTAMIRKLSGTTAVITGATSGIGREAALEFARAGVRVVVAGRREERLRELVDQIEATGGRALAVATDIAELAPGLMDLALGWSVPFIEGMCRVAAPPAGSGNLSLSAGRQKVTTASGII